jgi:dienelactone hydrolase
MQLSPLADLIEPVEERRPEKIEELKARVAEVRSKLWQLMGPIPDIERGPRWSDVHFVEGTRDLRQTGAGKEFYHERFYFTDGFGLVVTGRILIPRDVAEQKIKAPAVLYNHYHGGYFELGTDELFRDGWNFGSRLINDGYVVMAIDAPGHGLRLDPRYQEGANAERNLDTLLQMMGTSRLALRTYDDVLAFQLLAEHSCVDPDRVGAIGMSMGSARTWMLSALLPDKVACAVAVGTMPRLQDAIRTHTLGANNNNHFFPGQLAAGIEMESVILAAAGVPLKLIIGTEDRGSEGFRKVLDYNRWAWDRLGYGRRFQPDVMQGVGHEWPEDEVLAAMRWLNAHLKAPRDRSGST